MLITNVITQIEIYMDWQGRYVKTIWCRCEDIYHGVRKISKYDGIESMTPVSRSVNNIYWTFTLIYFWIEQ